MKLLIFLPLWVCLIHSANHLSVTLEKASPPYWRRGLLKGSPKGWGPILKNRPGHDVKRP